MADTWGRLTGKPGICMVTRGPGATNASAGLHVAKQDSIPMILFIGQIGRDMKEREAFQEVEYRRAFTEFAKWWGRSTTPAASRNSSPRLRRRHLRPPGSGRADAARRHAARRSRSPEAKPYTPVEAHPGPSQIAALGELSEDCEAPDGHSRRHPLERDLRRRHPGLCGKVQAAVVAPSAARCCLTTCIRLTRRCRHRHQPGARQGSEGSRSPHPARRPLLRNAVLVLHADGHPLPGTEARACASGPVRTRPRLPRRSRDLRHPGEFVSALTASMHPPPLYGPNALRQCTPPISPVNAAQSRPRRRADGSDHGMDRGQHAEGRDLHQWRAAIMPPGCTASTASRPSTPRPPRPRLHGLRPAGSRSRQAAVP